MRHWQVNRILLLGGVICAVALSSSGASARQQINIPSDTAITRTLTSEGTEFWLCFMKNFRERDPEKPGTYEPAVLEVFLTADDDADVQLEIPSLGFRHRLRCRGTAPSLLHPSLGQSSHWHLNCSPYHQQNHPPHHLRQCRSAWSLRLSVRHTVAKVCLQHGCWPI